MFEGIEYGLGAGGFLVAVLLVHAAYALRHRYTDTKFPILESTFDQTDLTAHAQIFDAACRAFPVRPDAPVPGARLVKLPRGKRGFALHLRDPFELNRHWSRSDVSLTSSSTVKVNVPFSAPYIYAGRVEAKTTGHICTGTIASTGEIKIDANEIRCRILTSHETVRLSSPSISFDSIAGYPVMANQDSRTAKLLRRMYSPAARAEDTTAPMAFSRTVHIPRRSRIDRSLSCYGDFHAGAASVIAAPIKVYGDVFLGDDVIVEGSLVVNGNLFVGDCCTFLSYVVVKGCLQSKGPCAFGPMGSPPIIVTAESILIRDGFLLNGTMRARARGGVVCPSEIGAMRAARASK